MREFRRHARRDARRIRRAERTVAFSILLVVFAIIFAAIGALMMTTASSEPASERTRTFLLGVFSAGLGVFFLSVMVATLVGRARSWRSRRAATQNALAHGWHYELEVDPREHPGSLFRKGVRGWAESAMHVHEPRYTEVGNYTFQAEQGKSLKALERIGYVCVQLDRRLPHLFLEAQGRERVRPYDLGFSGAQRMDLEGDFRSFFRVYAPAGYGEDALFVLTPDLMRLLVEEAPGCDVEIITDCLFVYAPGAFDLTTPHPLGVALRIAETIGARTAQRSSRYVDERADHPDLVDPSGARLATSRRWILTLVPGIAFVVTMLAIGWTQGAFG